MKGYWDNPEATAEAIGPDGFLRSGDLATMDANGYVSITGRAKEMIIRGGENIYPAEIENAIRELGAVADVAVIGVPDERYGEVCAAYVRLADGASLSAEEMREQMQRPRRPLQDPGPPAGHRRAAADAVWARSRSSSCASTSSARRRGAGNSN